MRRSTRWTAATGIAVAATLAATGSGLALASSPSPSPVTTTSTATGTATSKDSAAPVVPGKQPTPQKPGEKPRQDPQLAALARKLGVSPERLENALRDLKLFSATHGVKPTDPAAVAAFARDLGISVDQARSALQEIVAKPDRKKDNKPGEEDASLAAMARLLATRLRVSQSAAAAAMRQLDAMGRTGGIDPRSQPFAAVARQLGVSPAQLAQALGAIKRGMPPGKDDPGKASAPPNPSPSSKPAG